MLASLSPHQIQEVALAIGVLAGLVFAYGAFSVLGTRPHRRGSESAHRMEKVAYLVAALLLSVSFALSIVAIRTRTNPGGTAPSPGATTTP
jgi:hypothetical protein